MWRWLILGMVACGDPAPSLGEHVFTVAAPIWGYAADGETIVWTKDGTDATEIWAYDRQGPRRLYEARPDPLDPYWSPPGWLVFVDHQLYWEARYDWDSRFMALIDGVAVDTKLGGYQVQYVGASGPFIVQYVQRDLRVVDPRGENPWTMMMPTEGIRELAIGHGKLAIATATEARVIELGVGQTVTYPLAHEPFEMWVTDDGLIMRGVKDIYRVTAAGTTKIGELPDSYSRVVVFNDEVWMATNPQDPQDPYAFPPMLTRIERDGTTMHTNLESEDGVDLFATDDQLLAVTWKGAMMSFWRPD